jgi:ferredoxin
MGVCVPFGPMPVIRFVREGRDVECYPGENLREVALRERLELYGLKGQLGNCGGCGQCSTCFVSVVDENNADALTVRTPVEDSKLRRRPQEWRLACQALVEKSVMVLTRPQMRLPEAETRLAARVRLRCPWAQQLGLLFPTRNWKAKTSSVTSPPWRRARLLLPMKRAEFTATLAACR